MLFSVFPVQIFIVEFVVVETEISKTIYDIGFSLGNTIDNEKGYENFRGRAPKSDALMRARNFPITDKK